MKDVTVLMVFSVDGGKTFQCVAENGNGGGYAPAATPQQMRKVVSAWLATEKTEPETTLEEEILRLRTERDQLRAALHASEGFSGFKLLINNLTEICVAKEQRVFYWRERALEAEGRIANALL